MAMLFDLNQLTRTRSSKCSLQIVTILLMGFPRGEAATNIIDQIYGQGVGSFENGSYVQNGFPGNHMHLATNSSAITGWTIGGEAGIDWITSPDNAASQGLYCIDLSGTSTGSSIGSISITIPTNVGVLYSITFDAHGGDPVDGTNYPGVLTVGNISEIFNPVGTDAQSPIYTTYSFQFIASESETLITFSSTSSSAGYGPVIDNVFVSVPEVSPAGFMGFFAIVLATRRRR